MTLTVSEQLEARRRLIPIGENLFGNSDRLLAAGFESFVPYVKFLEAFCEETELGAFKEYLRESAKERIGCIDFIDPTLSGKGRCVYKSPLLEKLRQARDSRRGENFNSAIKNHDPSAMEIASFEIRKERLRYNEPEKYEALRQEYFRLQQQLRFNEVARFGSRFSDDPAPENLLARRQLSVEILGEKLAEFGYRPAKSWSTPAQAVFRKDFGTGRSLCWTLDTAGILEPVTSGGRRNGWIEFRLSIRSNRERSGKGSFRVPYDLGFLFLSWVYRDFQTIGELEVLIGAHVAAYSIVEYTILELGS